MTRLMPPSSFPVLGSCTSFQHRDRGLIIQRATFQFGVKSMETRFSKVEEVTGQRTMTGSRCAAAGCGRFVRTGTDYCTRHDGVKRRPVLRLVPNEPKPAEPGLSEEIGALRFVLQRLLAEEDDLARLAAGVARIASVVVQAAKAQQTMTGNRSDELAEALLTALADLDGDDAHDVIGGHAMTPRRDPDGASVSTAGCGADCDE
jgi:hypothetical protein